MWAHCRSGRPLHPGTPRNMTYPGRAWRANETSRAVMDGGGLGGGEAGHLGIGGAGREGEGREGCGGECGEGLHGLGLLGLGFAWSRAWVCVFVYVCLTPSTCPDVQVGAVTQVTVPRRKLAERSNRDPEATSRYQTVRSASAPARNARLSRDACWRQAGLCDGTRLRAVLR